MHHPRGVRLRDIAEPQLVHHRQRAGAHAQDVAHNPRRRWLRPDTARCSWGGCGFDFERDRPTVADVDHPAFSRSRPAAHRSAGLVSELTQMNLAGLCTSSARSTSPSTSRVQELVGRRPRMSRMRWYSSGLRPSSRTAAGDRESELRARPNPCPESRWGAFRPIRVPGPHHRPSNLARSHPHLARYAALHARNVRNDPEVEAPALI